MFQINEKVALFISRKNALECSDIEIYQYNLNGINDEHNSSSDRLLLLARNILL